MHRVVSILPRLVIANINVNDSSDKDNMIFLAVVSHDHSCWHLT